VVTPQNTMGNPETIKINPKINPLRFKVVIIFFGIIYEIKSFVS
jgi:hypothetical protein